MLRKSGVPRIAASLIALGVLAFLALAVRYAAPASRRGPVSGLVDGADARLSTSKFQWLLWTVVVLFALVEVFVERLIRGVPLTLATDPQMPVHLLVAMGLSAATMATAKGIAVAYSSAGLIDKSASGAGARRGGLLTDDRGVPDLSKVQMVSFSVIAIAVYVIRLLGQDASAPVLVDIDGSMMALTGLSQLGYLAKKVTTRQTPRITGVVPGVATPGQPVVVLGTNLGEPAATRMILVEGAGVVPRSWQDGQVEFEWPMRRASGDAWAKGDRVPVSILVNGNEAPNAMTVAVVVVVQSP